MTTYPIYQQNHPSRIWSPRIYDVFLAVLFLGPIISPLFRATGLPLVSDAGVLARDVLATYICPTPDRSYLLAGLPMAVCARCWGATIGLWMARLLPTGPGSAFRPLIDGLLRLPWLLRLLLCALPFLLWPLEIIGMAQGWWYAPLWLLLINGALAGFSAGLFFCSVWPGMWPTTAKHRS